MKRGKDKKTGEDVAIKVGLLIAQSRNECYSGEWLVYVFTVHNTARQAGGYQGCRVLSSTVASLFPNLSSRLLVQLWPLQALSNTAAVC